MLIQTVKFSVSSKRINYLTVFSFLFLSFALIRCANQLPPPGGEPDRIPPTIVEVYPKDGSTKFDDDNFEIEFSEFVDKRSVSEAIFISPFIDGALEYSWSGTTLEVTFPEKLKHDVTYTITIGTDVVDLNNKNRMAQSFMFSFSTGEKIDRKIISGRVFGKEKEGVFIYVYKLQTESDTLLSRKPDYVSQSGVDGKFSIQGLGEGKYRVFAVKDNFKDYLYHQDQDLIGIPQMDIGLNETDSIFTDVHFLLFNADTTKPRLISGIMTDRNHLLISCTKGIEHQYIYAENFSIFDSTNNQIRKIDYAFKGKTKPEEFILMFDSQINIDDEVYLFADTLIDLLGNVTINDFTKIIVSDRIDTNSIKIVSSDPTVNGQVDFENPEIKVFFDEAFNKDFSFSAVALTDTFNKPISFDINFYDDATLVIKPAENLKPDKDYLLKLRLEEFVDINGNKKDSLFTLKFKTISGLEFTGVSGNVIDLSFANSPYLVLENTSEPKFRYEKKVDSGKFEFNRVEPGKYLLWCYLDKNGNGKYDYGWPEPIEYSERFSFYPDTLNLRPRWEVSELIFKFK